MKNLSMRPRPKSVDIVCRVLSHTSQAHDRMSAASTHRKAVYLATGHNMVKAPGSTVNTAAERRCADDRRSSMQAEARSDTLVQKGR